MSGVTLRSVVMALVFMLANHSAFAQDPTASERPEAPASDPVAAPPAYVAAGISPDLASIPAGTLVTVELAETIASSTHKRGDQFPILLAEPLLLDGVEKLPAGTRGMGQITHAASAHSGGAPGELMIAARSLDTPAGPLQLGGLKIGGRGADNSNLAFGVSFAAGPFALFIRGREIVIPAGTRGTAKVKVATAATPPAADAATASPPSPGVSP